MSAPNEKNEPREMSPGSERHERLCAFVFGELQGAERAAFEAELARDPELAAERERLEATVKLVKHALPEEKLPDSIRATLSRAAARGPARRRFVFLRGGALGRQPIVRVAAAVLVLLGGVFAWRAMMRREFVPGSGDELARRQAPHASKVSREELKDAGRIAVGERGRKLDKDSLERLRGLGYVGEGPALKAETAPNTELARTLEAFGYTDDRSTKIGAVAEEGEAAGSALYTRLAQEQNAPSPTMPPSGVQSPQAGSDNGRFQLAGQLELVAPAEEPAPVDSLSVSIGVGAGSGGKSAARAGGAALARGRYKGPGDMAIAGNEGNAPGKYGGRFGGSRDLLGAQPERRAQAPSDQELAEQLEDLGYVAVQETPGNEEARIALRTGYVVGTKGTQVRASVAGESRRPVLTPEQVAAIQEQTLAACRIQPGESPAAMFFRCWGDHPFVSTKEDRLSTFGIDVDTASYTLARRFLNDGYLPRKAQVRTEEFVNYFRADAPAPTDGSTFAIGLEAAPSLFGGDPRVEMLRVTVRGKEVASFERQPLALTFVVDNSGSMQEGGRLELVKDALRKLLGVLSPTDSIAVVIFHQEARVLAPMTAASNRGPVEDQIARIPIEGGTNVEAGLTLGFEHALANLTPNAVNRVVLFSDGVGNIGETEAKALLAKVEAARKQGIYLNTFGVGMGNQNDAFLEELADKGDGLCQYLDSPEEAERALVQRFSESMQPIARDVKIQVELDPSQVESWRLLGYENRAIADEKFRDDQVDAGEVNAGHQVTALYEIVRSVESEGPFATVRLRYKAPFPVDAGDESTRAKAEAEVATEIERSIDPRAVLSSFASASAGYRRAVLVAEFAELLRRSVHARGDSRELLVGEAKKLERELAEPEFTEFVALVEKALPLLVEDRKSAIQPLLEELARLQYEKGQRELEEKKLAPEDEEAANRRIGELETEIRRKIGERHGIVDGGPEQQLRDLGYAGEDKDR